MKPKDFQLRFNSTLVQLKAIVKINSEWNHHCFNSTLVQLKVNKTNCV